MAKKAAATAINHPKKDSHLQDRKINKKKGSISLEPRLKDISPIATFHLQIFDSQSFTNLY